MTCDIFPGAPREQRPPDNVYSFAVLLLKLFKEERTVELWKLAPPLPLEYGRSHCVCHSHTHALAVGPKLDTSPARARSRRNSVTHDAPRLASQHVTVPYALPVWGRLTPARDDIITGVSPRSCWIPLQAPPPASSSRTTLHRTSTRIYGTPPTTASTTRAHTPRVAQRWTPNTHAALSRHFGAARLAGCTRRYPLIAIGDRPRPSTNYGGRWPLPLRRPPPSPPPSPPSSLPVAAAIVTAAAVPSAAAIKPPPPSHHPSTTRPARHTATPAHHPDAPARRPDPRPRPY
ncbi:hypothetical protein C8F04DRAFT_1405964 [Mycena alexandri]|uniref:Uncharacterized protein n=1 Tax=Mycena alexandri TaxID=1745969 RepID=A0AAD6RYM6_9AGAR|nr:hypothetical protein C8F04DRAFT_1405964 [Mycena alexandri]